ncbi:hypothetical protein BVX94_00500 [bacterium B17]|nr:hypothetical protein BVX94_00500 [bacterium B17]
MKYNYEKQYDFIAFDITSNCNLRCPFCLNDFSEIQGNINVSTETYKKVISLIPLLKDGGSFFFSCLFEPTLHPDFVQLLYEIPEEQRRKVFFTSNLAKPISDNDIKKLALSGIDHINISVDTLDPELMANIRKGIKYSVFHDNLMRIVDIFKKEPSAPKLNYITILLKDNLNECLSILKKCSVDYHANSHEFRCFWFHDYHDNEWISEHSINKNDWLELEDKLKNRNYKFTLGEHIDPPDRTIEVNETEPDLCVNPPFSALRISSSGMIEILRMPCDHLLDINYMTRPYETMKSFAEIHSLALVRGNSIAELNESERVLAQRTHALESILNTGCHRIADKILKLIH